MCFFERRVHVSALEKIHHQAVQKYEINVRPSTLRRTGLIANSAETLFSVDVVVLTCASCLLLRARGDDVTSVGMTGQTLGYTAAQLVHIHKRLQTTTQFCVSATYR